MAFTLKSDKKESTNKTIRFPCSMVERIEAQLREKDVSFSSFVLQACEYVLEDMEYRAVADEDPSAKAGEADPKVPGQG